MAVLQQLAAVILLVVAFSFGVMFTQENRLRQGEKRDEGIELAQQMPSAARSQRGEDVRVVVVERPCRQHFVTVHDVQPTSVKTAGHGSSPVQLPPLPPPKQSPCPTPVPPTPPPPPEQTPCPTPQQVPAALQRVVSTRLDTVKLDPTSYHGPLDWTRFPWPCVKSSQPCWTNKHDPAYYGSPLFRQRLKDYERVHKYMLEVPIETRHTDPETNITTVKRDERDRRFVVFNATNDGLGNKLLPFVSTFALALILNRTFLVDWPGRWPGTNPGHIREFFQPPSELKWHLEDLMEYVPQAPQRWTELNMRTPDANTEKMLLLCKNLHETFSNASVLVVPGDQYFLPLLSHNPHHAALFRQWFPMGEIFGPLFRFIATPAEPVQRMVRGFRRQHFSEYNVGLQIRSRSWVFANPALGMFWSQARKLIEANQPKGANVTVFVATDGAENRQMAERALGVLSGVNVVFPDKAADRNSIEGVKQGLMEILLLSSCNDLLVTAHSTFGASAHAIGGLYPFRVDKKRGVKQIASTEPSPHFWGSLMKEKTREVLKCVVMDMDYSEGPW